MLRSRDLTIMVGVVSVSAITGVMLLMGCSSQLFSFSFRSNLSTKDRVLPETTATAGINISRIVRFKTWWFILKLKDRKSEQTSSDNFDRVHILARIYGFCT